ncbi:MAG: glycosyltransferase [Ignavibacteriales bacterium]|nr:glycosyltransferase [Ignavibacteriales bacterium]
MRKVLIVAYYFPPLGFSGVQRTLKFAKYLPLYGWSPTIMTVTTTGYFAMDISLLKEIERTEIKVLRTSSVDPLRLFEKQQVVKMPSERVRKFLSRISDTFFIPDNKIGWKRPAVRAAAELLRKEKFDVIFATAPPQTAFLIGKKLKEIFGLPLVLDYRDPWVDYPFKFYPTPLHRYLNSKLEKTVLKASDAIVVASRVTKELLVRRYPYLTYNDVSIISQGYDPEDMNAPDTAVLPRTDKMRITYSGVFYENRTPVYFLEALQLVLKKNPRMRGRIEACFVGVFRNEHKNIINRLALQNEVNILGYLEHQECLKYVMASDVLWLMMQDDRSSPGKIYEYIGAQKKILGCLPKGFMRSTVEEAGGLCVDPTDVPAIASAIVLLFEQFEHHELRGPRPDIVDKYNRKILTGELAKMFAHLID